MSKALYIPGYFKGKKITMMGLGLLGRGIGDAKFLAEEGADLIVTDLKSAEELAGSVEALKEFPNIRFVLGEHRFEDFEHRDFILKAAGVPLDSPYIAHAEKQGIPVKMSTALFVSLTPATVVGITGTRGKSTVTHMLYEVLKNAMEGSGREVFLGGNVKGVSTLPYLRDTKEGDIAVLELDSWQLQGFGDERISPDIAVFTTFLPDHLNYYKGNMDAYLEDKANIFKFQKKSDCLILGEQVADMIVEKYAPVAHVFRAHAEKIPQSWSLPLPGEHNKQNTAIVAEVAHALTVPEHILKRSIENFKGISGRLEYIRTWNGVKIYNDTNATTPDATLAALTTLATKKNIVLIMGGADKALDMTGLLSSVSTFCKAIVFLPGTGSTRIAGELEKTGVKLIPVTSMEEAVSEASSKAKEGDIILLSPAFASFGLFKNEFDRGDQFNGLVKNLR